VNVSPRSTNVPFGLIEVREGDGVGRKQVPFPDACYRQQEKRFPVLRLPHLRHINVSLAFHVLRMGFWAIASASQAVPLRRSALPNLRLWMKPLWYAPPLRRVFVSTGYYFAYKVLLYLRNSSTSKSLKHLGCKIRFL
jgi:hypothetical protein